MRELAMRLKSKPALWVGVVIGTVLVGLTAFLVAGTGQAGGTANSASSSHSTRTPAPTHSASATASPHATSSASKSPSKSRTILSAFHGVLTWNDEFNSTAGLNGWHFLTGNVGGQAPLDELQYYDQSNASVSNGNLVLTATQGGGGHQCKYGPCRYTSVRMISSFSQAYGLFEARIKLAGGQGIWPAFWMQGDNYDQVGLPAAGEIDIAEVNGRPPVNVLSGFGHAPGVVTKYYDSLPQPLDAGYHIYGVEWTRTGITWFVDGKAYGYLAAYRGWPFNHPFNIILSLAVGGTWPGPPDATTHFPVSMYVNWIHVYRRA